MDSDEMSFAQLLAVDLDNDGDLDLMGITYSYYTYENNWVFIENESK
jgi:hypothetical protein